MGAFITIIGSIIIFIIGKFIYDSYLTNNTEDNWNKYLKEVQSQVTTKRNFSADKSIIKQSDINRDESLRLLALSYNCEISNAKNSFVALIKKELEVSSPEEILENLKYKKVREAQNYNIHQNDTPSAIMEEWFEELFEEELFEEEFEIEEFLNKEEIISTLKEGIIKGITAEAEKEFLENPTRDYITQSIFVIEVIETFSRKLELKMIEEKELYYMSEEEISKLIHECTQNVLKEFFKDIME